jgi:GTP-binding protein Era
MTMAHKAGYVNIIGEPNVGKSTLLNALLGEQLVITNPKAQTTRHRILGILNGEEHQLILSDTPGILEPQYRMQAAMMRAVEEALQDADLLIALVEVGQRPERSERLVERVRRYSGPLLVLVNKADATTAEAVAEACTIWQEVFPQAKVVAISALHGLNVDELRSYLIAQLPEHPPYFDKEDLSDRNMRFFVSEMIREKVLAFYKQEIPYSTQVVVNSFEEGETLTKIQADVIVMRESQKGIIIGQGGKALRKLGTEARLSIERFVGTKVFLDLRVKVDEDWREDASKLKRYGY